MCGQHKGRLILLIPKITIYNITSLDGRIDWASSSQEALFLYYGLSFNWKVDAILMGSNTAHSLGENENENIAVKLPKPLKNSPPPGTEELIYQPLPLLVIPDSGGKVHNFRLLQAEPWWRDIVVLCSKKTPPSYLEYLNKREIKYIIAGDDHVDMHLAFETLNKEYDVRSMRTDCGGTLNGVLLREGLVDEISLIISPNLVGNKDARTFFDDIELKGSNDMIKLKQTHIESLDNGNIWVCYDVLK